MQRRSAATVVLIGTAVGALLAFVVAAALWHSEGGRWYDVRTASMGRAAPVGSLLLTRPVAFADVRPGDLITFHAPGSGAVYSHRVVSRTATGLQTQGDINPVRDAWTLHAGDLVGRVVWQGPALGWALRGLPAVLLCGALVAMASSLVQRRRRGSVRILGASATVAALGWVLHPWVGLERIGSSEAERGVVLRVVSTGLLPVKVSAVRGDDAHRLVNGAVADVHVTRLDAHHAYSLDSALSLGTWWWVGLALACLAPLLWTLVVGLEPVVEEPEPVPGRHTEVIGWMPWTDELDDDDEDRAYAAGHRLQTVGWQP